MILEIRDINTLLLPQFNEDIRRLVKHFVKKSRYWEPESEIWNKIVKSIALNNVIFLVSTDGNRVSGFAIIETGTDSFGTKSGHIRILSYDGNGINWTEGMTKIQELLKERGIHRMSFGTPRNSTAFNKLFNLNGYKQYTCFEKEV